jgi:4-cresol dehydrogenase (hydroxylating) flavoprotein subunit
MSSTACPSSDLKSFLREAPAIVGPQYFLTEPQQLEKLADNTLGVLYHFAAAAYPSTTEEVEALVRLACLTGTPLYPISRGRNVGYGDRTPVLADHVLLDLSRMRSIREYDPVLGQVVIEAGVSQQDLYTFLRQQNAPYWMDATGAGNEASIVGNTLEGGFGHTPLGNHREEFTDVEVVLGNGRRLRTGRFPGFGPDIKGLFVQSNFGVVTAMRIRLLRCPEHFESFVLRCDDKDGLGPLVDTLRQLRQEGVINSCVHLANPVRYLMSSRRCPPEFRDRVVEDLDGMRIMSSPLLPVGYWNAAGGLYGLRRVVAAQKKRLKNAFRGIATVNFFSNARLNHLRGLMEFLGKFGIATAQKIGASLDSFRHIHALMQGVPSDEAYRNILWRVENYDNLGLIWFAPTVDAKGDEAQRLVELARPLFQDRRFDMPLTITLVTPDRLVGIYNIVFHKNDPEERDRAHGLYHDLRTAFRNDGITTYRSSILGMEDFRPTDAGMDQSLCRLKSALDPCGVISKGRYGIRLEEERKDFYKKTPSRSACIVP